MALWLARLGVAVDARARAIERRRAAASLDLVDPLTCRWDGRRFELLRQADPAAAADWARRCHLRDPADGAVASALLGVLLQLRFPWLALTAADHWLTAAATPVRGSRRALADLLGAFAMCGEVEAGRRFLATVRRAPREIVVPDAVVGPGVFLFPGPGPGGAAASMPLDPVDCAQAWLRAELAGERLLSRVLLHHAVRLGFAWPREVTLARGRSPRACVTLGPIVRDAVRAGLSRDEVALGLVRAAHARPVSPAMEWVRRGPGWT